VRWWSGLGSWKANATAAAAVEFVVDALVLCRDDDDADVDEKANVAAGDESRLVLLLGVKGVLVVIDDEAEEEEIEDER